MMRTGIAAICIVAVLSCCLCTKPPSVQWTRTFDHSYDTMISWVQQTKDKGFIAAGHVVRNPNSGLPVDMYLLKMDPTGNTQWQTHFGSGPTHDEASSVEQTLDGGYVLAGYGGHSGAVVVLKTDSLGHRQWRFCAFPAADAWDILQTRDGGYITGGLCQRHDSLFLLKLDSLGKVEWTRTYYNGPHIHAWEGRIPLRQTRDGGYIVGAEVLVKADSLGNRMWSRDYERTLYTMYSVEQTADGGYIATGVGPLGWPFRRLTRKQTFERLREDSRFLLNWVVLKTDSMGNPRCRMLLADGTWLCEGRTVTLTRHGGYVFSGSISPSTCLIRTNSLGIPLWMKTFDDMGVDCCQQTEDGGYILSDGENHIRKLAPEGK